MLRTTVLDVRIAPKWVSNTKPDKYFSLFCMQIRPHKMRSADEGQTIFYTCTFYTCTECGHTRTENS